MPKRARRLFRQQRSLDHEFTVEWDELGLTQRWSEGAFRTRWSEYYNWFETDEIMAFGINERMHHFVSKRGMTVEQSASLRTAATAIAGPGARA